MVFRHIVRKRAKETTLRGKKKSVRLFLDSDLLAQIETAAKFSPSKLFFGLDGHTEMFKGVVPSTTQRLPIAPSSQQSVSPVVALNQLPTGVISRPRPLAEVPSVKAAQPKIIKARRRKPRKPRANSPVIVPPVLHGRIYLIPRPQPVRSITTTISLDRDYIIAREMRVRQYANTRW